MSHQILPEIVDNIVDFVNVLPDDVRKLSLIICSQVSRNLNARSWHHLFRRIDITKGTRLREFLSIIGSAAFTNYVRELRLGRLWAQARTAAHTPKDDGICLDARAVSKLLATLLKLKQETLIIGRDVQWSPIQLPLRPTDSLSPPTSRVFIPIPIGSGTRRDIWAQKPKWAPPCGPFALRDAAANNREGVGFRMVEMAALPLSSGGMRMMSTEVAVPPEFVAAAEEVFLRIGDPGRVKAVDELVLKSMRNVPAVDIRWVAPDSLMSSNASGVVTTLGLTGETSLTSLTLWTTLRPRSSPGMPRTASREWAANLDVLQAVPPQQIRRIRIGVIVDEGCRYEDAVQQVKQLKWAGLGPVLRALTGLDVVEGMVVAADKELDKQIWDVVWRGLRSVGAGDGSRLVRGEPKIL